MICAFINSEEAGELFSSSSAGDKARSERSRTRGASDWPMYTLISSSSPLRFNWVVFFTAALASGWSFPFPLAALSAAFFSLGVFAFPSSFSILNLSSVAWKERTFFLPNHTVSKQWFFYSQVDLLCTHLFHHCLLIYSIFRPRQWRSGWAYVVMRHIYARGAEGWVRGD